MLQKITQTEALFIVLNAEEKHLLQGFLVKIDFWNFSVSRSDKHVEPKQEIAENPVKSRVLCSVEKEVGTG